MNPDRFTTNGDYFCPESTTTYYMASGDVDYLKDDGRRYWPIDRPYHLDWQKLGLWFIAMLINGGLWVGIIYAITWLL